MSAGEWKVFRVMPGQEGEIPNLAEYVTAIFAGRPKPLPDSLGDPFLED